MEVEVSLPYNFSPRDYQFPFWRAMDAGCKRAVLVWHRRSGKDLTVLNWAITKMVERVGLYWHLLPTYNQGRKIVWDGMTKDGRKFLDHFPPELVEGTPNKTDMQVKIVNGSIYQVVGTDYVDRLVGSNPIGVIFSEYALQDPRAWELIRPILRENGGWAIFPYTPRGKNHGKRLFDTAKRLMKKNGSWFAEHLTVEDTGVITEQDLLQERDEGMSEEMLQQEYYCSWEAGIPGAYFSLQIVQARKENRITHVPWHSETPVDTWWDLGMDDSMSIWFTQDIGREVHCIDYYENSGEGFPHYAKMLRDKPYVYGRHTAPHDIKVKELGTGRSRLDAARNFGIRFDIAKKVKYKEDAIEMARNFFSVVWFDELKCARGIDCLEGYRKEYDEKTGTFKEHPVRDWSCHGADSFMTLAQKHDFIGHRIGSPLARVRRMRVGAIDAGAGY
jgi:phage terminase large subunit